MLLRQYLPNEGADILQLFGEQLVTSENGVEMVSFANKDFSVNF
jgi:hypothetical protein